RHVIAGENQDTCRTLPPDQLTQPLPCSVLKEKGSLLKRAPLGSSDKQRMLVVSSVLVIGFYA
ncbi:MAG: hypothetical protein ACK6AT_15615, partial [Planctomycetota bacterium]